MDTDRGLLSDELIRAVESLSEERGGGDARCPGAGS